MKRLLMLLVCITFLVNLSAMHQKDQKIPEAARSGFTSKFPSARKVKWSIEKPGEYEAEYISDGVEASAVFDSNGKLIETETEIKQGELPQAVNASLASDFSGYKFDEIERVTDASGKITFEMVVSKRREKLEISFDAKGKLLVKEPLKEEN